MEKYEQTTLFPKEKPADVMPSSTSWNLWHGCRNYVEDYIIGSSMPSANTIWFLQSGIVLIISERSLSTTS